MAQEVLSKDIIIFYNGKAIAKATSFSFEVSKEAIDISTLSSENWATIIGGKKSFSGSIDGLVTRGTTAADQIDYHQLFTEIVSSDIPVEIAIATTVSGDTYYSGQAILTGLTQSASAGEVITYSASYSGSGGLLKRLVGSTNDVFTYTLPMQLA